MNSFREEDIAVIGMAGRFPGATTLDQFWQNLSSARETITQFSDEELRAAGIDDHLLQHPNYVRAKGIVDKAEYFDPAFFGLSLQEAKLLDPQQRLFLLCAWEAIENAGFVAKKDKNRVGVFASSGMNLYLLKNILTNQELLANTDEYQLLLANDKDFLATRTSYLFNLHGPSVNLQTGCSSSLVCVHYACQSILNGECDLALAGGVSLTVPQQQGYLYKKEMIGSPDGHCYAFDERAQGTVKSNGAGVVLLKPLADAVRDNDHIYAVIRGTAINNDGAQKVGYTAPGVQQQAAVIREAMRMADVTPDELSYIETHGTGTLLGDPIEIAALKQAFATHQSENKCALASLKTNLGHLDVAAGIAGFIKVCLSIYHAKIPASLNFKNLNPKINLQSTPFYINTELRDWPLAQKNRIAGLSAFGIGGTNVHLVLQQAPKRQFTDSKAALFMFSARSAESLAANAKANVTYLQEHSAISLADMAYSLQQGRESMPYRFACYAQSAAELVNQIESCSFENIQPLNPKAALVFMFSGQGSQYLGMAAQLYYADTHFSHALDECIQALQPWLNYDLKSALLTENAESAFYKQTAFAQPALFAVEYALAQSYVAYGVKPTALIGHSIGEYTAAVMAGVFSLPDAAKLIAARSQLMQQLAPGVMMAVHASKEKIAALLPATLDIALENAPNLTVVAGAEAAIQAFASVLEQQGIQQQLLATSHAFHSRMMDPMLDEFKKVVSDIERHAPSVPIASNVSGTWLTADEAMSENYWVQQVRQTVKFSAGLMQLQARYAPFFLEVGPGRALQQLTMRHGIKKVAGSMPAANETLPHYPVFMKALAQVWMAGSHLINMSQGKLIPLPTYQWQLTRCWIDVEKTVTAIGISKKSTDTQSIFDLTETIWKTLLGVTSVSEQDHFFQLGGNSLTAIQLIDRLPPALQKEVSVVHVYQYPKFGDFIDHLQKITPTTITPINHTDEKDAENALFSAAEEL